MFKSLVQLLALRMLTQMVMTLETELIISYFAFKQCPKTLALCHFIFCFKGDMEKYDIFLVLIGENKYLEANYFANRGHILNDHQEQLLIGSPTEEAGINRLGIMF